MQKLRFSYGELFGLILELKREKTLDMLVGREVSYLVFDLHSFHGGASVVLLGGSKDLCGFEESGSKSTDGLGLGDGADTSCSKHGHSCSVDPVIH